MKVSIEKLNSCFLNFDTQCCAGYYKSGSAIVNNKMEKEKKTDQRGKQAPLKNKGKAKNMTCALSL